MRYFDFDKNNVTDVDTLTPDQIAYIKKPSLTILAPLNVLLRSQWDILACFIVIEFIKNRFWDVIDSPSSFLAMHSWILSAFFYLIPAIYGIFHGRRLAWNRNNWVSFDEFQKSERNWLILFVVFCALSLLFLLTVFFLSSTQPQ